MTPTQELYEGFLINIDEEHDHLLIYFTEISNLINTKKKEIENQFKNEDYKVKLSFLQQPMYSVYKNKFADILCKSLIVTLIANFENNLFNLITILTNGQTTKQNIKGKQRQSYIYCGLEFLYNKFNVTKEQSYYSDPILIQFFINVRNSIVHNNSKINNQIKKHQLFETYDSMFIIEDESFRFNDIKFIHCLLKTSRTYFNSFAHFIK